jgi:hypothetical protein
MLKFGRVDGYLPGATIEGVIILLVEWVFTAYVRNCRLDPPLLQQACAKQAANCWLSRGVAIRALLLT